MRSKKSGDAYFIATRDLALVELTVRSGKKLTELLRLSLQDVVWQSGKLLALADISINSEFNRVVADYVSFRQQCTYATEALFIASSGSPYAAAVFKRNLWRMCVEANLNPADVNLAAVKQQQYRALMHLRFAKQRPLFQQYLAVALCVFTGARPGEVAQLTKKNLLFYQGKIEFEQTKSGQAQYVYLPQPLYAPLKAYVAHLPSDTSPLFVSETGRQWDYKCVNQAVDEFSQVFSKQHPEMPSFTPRTLRKTFGSAMAKMVPLKDLQELMRHKDPKTTMNFYIAVEEDYLRRAIERNVSPDTELD